MLGITGDVRESPQSGEHQGNSTIPDDYWRSLMLILISEESRQTLGNPAKSPLRGGEEPDEMVDIPHDSACFPLISVIIHCWC